MRRRDFLALAGAAATSPRIALAQVTATLPKVTVLTYSALQPTIVDAFLRGLADYGYVDGRTITVEYFAAPTIAELPVFAGKVLAGGPDVIWANGATAAQALQQATQTTPIVFYSGGDPVQLGLVQSLAHPGGNLTGAISNTAVAGKVLERMRAILPDLRRAAVFQATSVPTNAGLVAEARAAAEALRVELTLIDTHEGEDFRTYFAAANGAGAQAVYFVSTVYFATTPLDSKVHPGLEQQIRDAALFDRDYLAAGNGVVTNNMLLAYLGAQRGMPTGSTTVYALGGSLVGYGADSTPIYRRAGYYIDAILKGAKPADLAVELPTKFDMTLNLKAAKALGLTVPPLVVGTAAQVVE